MRAIRYYGPGDMRLDRIPEPQVGERQVKIKASLPTCYDPSTKADSVPLTGSLVSIPLPHLASSYSGRLLH